MLKKLKNIIFILLLCLGCFFVSGIVLADELDLGKEYAEDIGLAGDEDSDVRVIIANIIRVLLGFLGLLAVSLILYGGWMYMSSDGSADKMDKARKIITNAVVGLIIILSSFAIVTFVMNAWDDVVNNNTGSDPNPNPIPNGSENGGSSVSCDGNTLTSTCDADATMCDDNYYCDADTCTCEEGGGYGDACDGDTSTAECEADSNLCSAYLYCDYEEGCICLGTPVIESLSPEGGFCDGDINTACQSDDDCVSFSPATCNTDTPNGAEGNLVTISGRYFGDYEAGISTISFWNDSDFVEAKLAGSVNPDCDNSWTNTQIIAVVPAGATSGSIKVIGSNGEDTTDNDVGPFIDFVVNTIARPGLCKINPDNGVMNDKIDYYGLSLAGVNAFFGSLSTNVQAIDSAFNSILSGSAYVSNITTGTTTTFVLDANNIGSNYLKFGKSAEPYDGPFITSFEPTEGNIGQYVTIYGSDFGSSKGSSHVYFGDDVSRVEASYDFPDVCADSVWSDGQVIIKVPNGLTNRDYNITMTIDDWVIISPNSFTVDSSLDLLPSLCKIDPIMGQNNSEVTLWGEYFYDFNSNSKVRFYLNHDQSDDDISFWGEDEDEEADKIETTVHSDTVTGPVKVVIGENIGNGVNFTVGECSQNDDCGSSNVCCPLGSYAYGRCVGNIDECYVDIPSSVYEWDFSTGLESDSSVLADSCSMLSNELGYCAPYSCPNSPGQCSPYTASDEGIVVGNCVYNCEDVGSCTSSTCIYNSNLDRCVVESYTCNLTATTTDALGQVIDKYCAEYNGQGHWHIDTILSCPDNWTMISGNMCVDSTLDSSETCSLCDSDFECVDDNNVGLCVVDQDICPGSSTCSSTDECIKKDESTCDCCCEIGEDERDCCTPLTCEGICGDDTDADSGKTNSSSGKDFGRCSGCRIEVNGVVDQDASDQACNCESTSGKYCDVDVDVDGDGEKEGVCNDCSQLSIDDDMDGCSDHSSTCCIDGKLEDPVCRGGDGSLIADEYFGYCAYYKCDDNLAEGCYGTAPDYTAVINGEFIATSTCVSQCNEFEGNPVGEECINGSFDLCQTGLDDCGEYLSCIDEESADCRCCCDPDNDNDNDKCGEINTGDENTRLSCHANQEPCSGDERGLCCGCMEDLNCGATDTVGCGSDTCCRTRPAVETVVPDDGDTEICRNALISAEFDQTMDSGSFSGNIIVVGEYQGECPEDTEYLTLNIDNYKIKQKIPLILDRFNEFVKNIFIKQAIAANPDSAFNYCAVSGSVSSYHSTDGKTSVKFSPQALLDAGREYYVIIKGDKDLDSTDGVLSYYGIGMSGDNDPILNGVEFKNSEIWSFTTLSDQADDNGVCEIDHVEIEPSYYLFQTTEGSLNESDTDENDGSFDTEKDNDKVFMVQAFDEDNQILTPVSGYSWNWDWSIDNTSVVTISSDANFDSNGDRQLIRANSEVVNENTYVNAELKLTESSYSSIGDGETGRSEVWVFLCDNPWPAINNGTWQPWRDSDNNCIQGTGDCYPFNHEFYYCRDSGGVGTADDLPVISYSTIIGSSTIQDILKEYYFFREEVPDASGSFSVDPNDEGGSVTVTLPSNTDGIAGYKLYWGTSSGNYSNYLDVGTDTYINEEYIHIVDNLTNDQLYYFNLTSYTAEGAESEYYGEVTVIPQDTEGPTEPSIEAIPGDGQVEIAWVDNSSGDAISFRIYYKADSTCNASTNFANSISIPYSESATSTISGLNNGTEYCFGMIAYDEEYNTSTTTVSATPFAVPSNFTATVSGANLVFNWDQATGASSYKIYYGQSSGDYVANTSSITGTEYTFTGLNNAIPYYFTVVSVDGDGHESDYSQEVSASPFVAPTNLTLTTASSTEVILNWDSVDNITSYRVYYGENSENYDSRVEIDSDDYVEIDGVDTITIEYTLTGLTNGTTYYFAVTAIDENNESDYSNETSGMPFGTPTNLTATASTDEITLSWDEVLGISDYKIYYRTELESYTDNNSVVVTDFTSGTVSNLTDGTLYYFVVTSVNGNYESDYSEEVSGTPN